MADLIAFPQRRNIGKARHVAALWMQRRPGAERDGYWRIVSQRYAGVMRRLGFTDAVVNRELRDFCALVETEILAIQDRTERHVLDAGARFVAARDVTTDNSPGAA